jgi:hypothetical protein
MICSSILLVCMIRLIPAIIIMLYYWLFRIKSYGKLLIFSIENPRRGQYVGGRLFWRRTTIMSSGVENTPRYHCMCVSSMTTRTCARICARPGVESWHGTITSRHQHSLNCSAWTAARHQQEVKRGVPAVPRHHRVVLHGMRWKVHRQCVVLGGVQWAPHHHFALCCHVMPCQYTFWLCVKL